MSYLLNSGARLQTSLRHECEGVAEFGVVRYCDAEAVQLRPALAGQAATSTLSQRRGRAPQPSVT